MKVTQKQLRTSSPPPPVQRAQAPDDSKGVLADIAEIGAVKTASQHVGNIGFGLASAIAFGSQVRNLFRHASPSMKLAALAPVLHLGVAAVEGYNSAKKYGEGDPVVAATAAGNAVGCFAAFLETGAAMAMLGEKSGLAVAMGATGGALGLGAGVVEVRQGLKNVKAGGSHRVLLMGVLDIASGLTSFAGAAVALRGVQGPLAPALMLAASTIDMSGIAIDYLGHKGPKQS